MSGIELIEKGILQFGLFDANEDSIPLRVDTELIAAYPDLLDRISRRVVLGLQGASFERLLATSDSVALGAVVSQKAHIPLVYSRGSNRRLVDDLVGVYDIGHPTCLITGSISHDTGKFMQACKSVGLEVEMVVQIVAMKHATIPNAKSVVIYDVREIIDKLAEANYLSPAYTDALLEHIAKSSNGIAD